MTTYQCTTPSSSTDPSALAESGLGLVYTLASRVYKTAKPYVEYNELVSFGTIGLMQAARRYDPSRDASFHTYAYRRIHGAILDGLGTLGPMSRTAWRKHKQALDRDARTVPMRRSRIASYDVTPADTVGLEHAKRALSRAMQHLPETQSRLLERCYYHGDTLQQAGNALGISKSWSSRLHERALCQLRKELADHG